MMEILSCNTVNLIHTNKMIGGCSLIQEKILLNQSFATMEIIGSPLPSPMPIVRVTNMTENHENMKSLHSSVQYQKHQWKICDFKVVSSLLGLQIDYTKHYVFHVYGIVEQTKESRG